MTRTPALPGADVHVSRALPIRPTPGEVGRRIVRHGLAAHWTDFETWAGPIGPAPAAAIHATRRANVVLISPALAPKLRVVRDMATGVDTMQTHDRQLWNGPDYLTDDDLAALPDRPTGPDRRVPIHRGHEDPRPPILGAR